MTVSADVVKAALADVKEPKIGKPMIELGMIGEVTVEGERATIHVELATPSSPLKDRMREDIEAAVKRTGITDIEIVWDHKQLKREMAPDDPCPSVQNIILVVSGKGGVGKSTVATNVALALKRSGSRVGILDADMYGPSIPTMLGVMGRPGATEAGKIRPLERFGVKLMSIGFLIEDEKTAVVWRGPMLQGALMQFLKDVEWGDLDYLVLDLPPGTGDIVLTLSQRVRSTGAVIVTTPQDVALADVYKSVAMLKKVNIPILGVVENESYFVCDGCDKRHELFGAGGGQKVAEFSEAPLLGQIPMHPAVREWGDAGTPVVQAAPASEVASSFIEVAERVADRCSVVNAERAPTLTIDRSGGANRHLPIAR